VKPNPAFLNQEKSFWAFVRTLTQQVGYTERGKDEIKIPTLQELEFGLAALSLDVSAVSENGSPTDLGQKLLDYFVYRASAIDELKAQLMTGTQAAQLFKELKKNCRHVCDMPLNKQKGKKKAFAYLTCMVTMLLEEALEKFTPVKLLPVPEPATTSDWLKASDLSKLGTNKYIRRLIKDGKIRKARHERKFVYHPADVQRLIPHCDYDPRTLTTVTVGGRPVRTLARRVDGAYPAVVNPIAIWEIKEYYYTTSFGSRVADGIYETLLDGAELEDLKGIGHSVRHYLFVDAYETWWEDGKSYLCRLVDAMHMGYVDEVLFGREIIVRVPELAREWSEEKKTRQAM
jgi:hypothetical protein